MTVSAVTKASGNLKHWNYSLDSSRPYKRLLKISKTRGSRDLFLPKLVPQQIPEDG